MDRAQALALLTRYYAAFNAGDWEGMLEYAKTVSKHREERASVTTD
mgnify:CR=1 FL=1